MTDNNAAAIIEYLKGQAEQYLKSAIGSATIQPFEIGTQGNFYYNYLDSLNSQNFNLKTYNWISSALQAGAQPFQLGASSFTNTYGSALASVSYTLSTEDQANLTKAISAATAQSTALQQVWQSQIGKFPSPSSGNPTNDILTQIATKWATPPTDFVTMQNTRNLASLLNAKPPTGASVLSAVTNYLAAISGVVSLQNSVSLNTFYINHALAAVQTPSTANGGMTLNDQSVRPAYSISPSQADIENALQNAGSSVTASMTVTQSSSKELKVNISGGGGFTIPVLDFLTIGVQGNANYFSDHLTTSETDTTVDMTFPGVNYVSFGPAPFDESGNTSGWFWEDPINDAVANTNNKNVTGWKFSPKPNIDFSENGSFGYPTGVAICGYPTIKITATTANYDSVKTTFDQSSGIDVGFLGIPIISASDSTNYASATVDASSSSVTITITPPQQVVAGAFNDAQAWVLGVTTAFPAAASVPTT